MVDGNTTPDLDLTLFGADVSAALQGNLQLPVDPSGVIQMASSVDVIGHLPPAVASLGRGALTAIGTAADAVAGAMPAINLIGDIASGHGPTDPQEIIGALSATAALINPLAGAIIGAAGEAMAGLNTLGEETFQALGLIDKPPPQYTYFGFAKQGELPWGPTDPRWKSWDYWMTPVGSGWRWGTLSVTAETLYRESAFANILESLGRYPRAQKGLGPPYDGPTPQNDFEAYFFTILKKDLENWMNAYAAVPPYALLQAAAALWNHTHPNGTPRVYSASNVQHWGNSVGEGANPIEVILSVAGDTSNTAVGGGQDKPPISVNVNPVAASAGARGPLGVFDALRQTQQQIAAAMPAAAPKKVISMKGVVAPPPKTTIDLRPVARAIAAQAKAPAAAPPKPQSLLQKYGAYAPAVAGALLLPIAGPLALVGGLAGSGLWYFLKK